MAHVNSVHGEYLKLIRTEGKFYIIHHFRHVPSEKVSMVYTLSWFELQVSFTSFFTSGMPHVHSVHSEYLKLIRTAGKS